MKSGITVNVDVSANIRENIMRMKINYIWSLSTCTCESGKYSKIVISDSKFTLGEFTVTTKTIARKNIVNKKNYLFYFPFY